MDTSEPSGIDEFNRFDVLARPVTLRLLLVIAGAFAALIPACILYLINLPNDYVLAEFDCGGGRSILLYADTFCDQADIPLYEVRQASKVIAPRVCTTAIFQCGQAPTAKDFKLVTREGGNLVAFVQLSEGKPILIYDFASGKSWPRGETDAADEPDLKRRLAGDAPTDPSESFGSR